MTAEPTEQTELFPEPNHAEPEPTKRPTAAPKRYAVHNDENAYDGDPMNRYEVSTWDIDGMEDGGDYLADFASVQHGWLDGTYAETCWLHDRITDTWHEPGDWPDSGDVTALDVHRVAVYSARYA